MWDNEDWAARHISKHGVTTKEAWEVVFEKPGCHPLLSPDQLRFPPYRRYWTIGKTVSGRMLFVVWEQWRATKNLITAFEPSQERVKLYESKTRKKR